MDLIEMPLEAFALRLYSIQSASLFPWIAAAFAAAVSLWSIRAVGSSSAPFQPEPEKIPVPSPAKCSAPECSPEAPSSPSKERLTVYYNGDGCDGCCSSRHVYGVEEEEEQGGNGVEDLDGVSSDGEVTELAKRTGGVLGWELHLTELAVRRRLDLGWYRYQDMTELNGNVVKLWDGVNGGLTVKSLNRRRMTRVDWGYSSSI